MGSGRQNTYDCVLGGRAEGRLFQGRGGVGWEQGGEVRWGGGGGLVLEVFQEEEDEADRRR